MRFHSGLLSLSVPIHPLKKENQKKEKKKNSLVDSIREILRLNRDAATPDHLLIDPFNALRALQIGTPIHPIARVQHHAGLIGPQLRLDARKLARQRQHRGPLGRVLDQPVPVVALAGAVGAAVAGEAGLVARVAEEQVRGGGEVVDGVGRRREDVTGGERALVRLEVALGVGHGQGVLPDFGGGRVAVGVEVEVGVLGEENGWSDRLVRVHSQVSCR